MDRPLTPKELIIQSLEKSKVHHQNNINVFIDRLKNPAYDKDALQKDINWAYENLNTLDAAIHLFKKAL